MLPDQPLGRDAVEHEADLLAQYLGAIGDLEHRGEPDALVADLASCCPPMSLRGGAQTGQRLDALGIERMPVVSDEERLARYHEADGALDTIVGHRVMGVLQELDRGPPCVSLPDPVLGPPVVGQVLERLPPGTGRAGGLVIKPFAPLG
jgi:hypothetical protein